MGLAGDVACVADWHGGVRILNVRAFDLGTEAAPRRRSVYTIDSVWNVWQEGVADYE